MRFHFLILAFNEEKKLKITYDELIEIIINLRLQNYKITIIDDGSTDNTSNVVKYLKRINPSISLISNNINLGVAQSVKNYVKNSQDGKLIIISGDNDLDKKIIYNLIKSSENVDFVLSFFVNNLKKKGLIRATLSIIFNKISCILFNVSVRYLQGPFVWPLNIVKNYNIHSKGICYVSEVNIKLLRDGLTFQEVDGSMNTGSDGSTSIKIKNFIDIFLTFIKLIYEIYFMKKYNKLSKKK